MATKIQDRYEQLISKHKEDVAKYEEIDFIVRLEMKEPSLNTKINNDDILNDNLYIFGNTGVGKTYFCQQLISGRGSYFKWYDIVNDALDGSAKFSKYTTPAIIVIDDFLSRKPTEYNINMFYEIIDKRLELGKQTIITTNYTKQEFKNVLNQIDKVDKHLQARIYSRMNTFSFYEFKGEDLRKKNSKLKKGHWNNE